MINADGAWIGFGVGDVDNPDLPRTSPNWDAITLLTATLHDKYQWARDLGVVQQPNYDTIVAGSVAEFCSRTGIPVVKDPNGFAVANLAVRTRLGSYPPPPPPTHVALTVRGTGGVIGQDYTSQIAQALPGQYHEVPVDYAASMGGIPVGAATDPNAPSGDECADQVYSLLTQWVESTTATFSLFAYSLGTKGVVQFLNDMFTDGHPLAAHQNRLVCVVLIGDPWRPFGHTFYLGPIPDGEGIGAPYFTMSDAAIAALGWRCCWLAQPTDMYTNSPLGATGQVLADVEQIVLATAVSDPLGTIEKAIPYLLQLVQKDAGLTSLFGSAGGLLTSIAGGAMPLTASLVGLLLPVLESGFQGLLAGVGSNGTALPAGPAADVQAAVLALKFYGGGIQGHVTYHSTAWSPNSPQTYLQLGVQHAADWGARVPVLT
ncbi:hypothetical protein [Mycolicibacterium sphagni]|uniref:hypothetical protein n=1 Tax=Mycolicibacterium sphagni TaxID=1786 RepID=UPI0021F389E8|nr:hypothetical protein [Mycolicibacterium sphagni]MCV7174894.1 hypothetical protein [Mycolicibacterium sphagni]